MRLVSHVVKPRSLNCQFSGMSVREVMRPEAFRHFQFQLLRRGNLRRSMQLIERIAIVTDDRLQGGKMVSVVYEAPETLEGAINLLANADKPAKILAGGTDLIIQTRASKDSVRLFVDVKKIAGMLEAKIDASGLTLGPCMPCAQFCARRHRSCFPGIGRGCRFDWINANSGQGKCGW